MRKSGLLLLLIAAGCSRCGQKSAASAEELIPSRPPGALVLAPLGSVAAHLQSLAARAETLPGGEQLADLRKGIAGRLGFDLFAREGLISAGIDPDRGAAVGYLTAGRPEELVVALPLVDPDKFMETAQRLAVDRLGYTPGAEGSRQAKVFVRGSSQLGIGVVRGYGLVTRGADAGKLIAQAAARKPEESLARDGGLKAVREKLGAADLVIYAPQGSPFFQQHGIVPLPGDAAWSATASAQGLVLRLFAQMPADAAARAQAILPGGGAWLASLLPAEAPVQARLGIAGPKMLETLARLPQLAPLLAKADLGELVASLAPGTAISLGVEKSANLGHLVDYGLDWRKQSPFETVQLVALAQIADQPRFDKALAALLPRLPSLGMQVARTGDDFQITYSGGKGARFGSREIDGKKVAYLIGGALKPEELKAGKAEATLSQEAGAAGRADLGKLYDAIHALPQEAYGSGPQSYVTKALVGQVIDPLRPVRITGSAQAGTGSFEATLNVELVAP